MLNRYRTCRAGLAVLAVAAAAAGCGVWAGEQASRAGSPLASRIQASLQDVPSPAAPESAQPHLAAGKDGRVFASWLERVGTGGARRFRFAVFDGRRWSEPGTIIERDRFFANWADVPSIAVLGDGTLAAHWLEMRGPGKYAYDVKVSLSRDRGRTWSRPVSPHRDGTETEHGFATLFERPGGGLGLVWLDGRDFATHGGGAMVGMVGMKGEMSLRATAFDGDAPRPETLVDGRTCDCCPTASARVEGGLIVAYRDRSAEEIRDISIARFDGTRWSEPARVHADNWKIPGCPVNGPALASDGATRVAVAWFTAAEGQAQVKVAFSRDGGRSFAPPVRADLGVPVGRVALELLSDGRALVGWIEQKGHDAEFRLRRVGPDGADAQTALIASLTATRASGYPRMARSGDQLVFAWTDAAQPSRVRTAVARMNGS